VHGILPLKRDHSDLLPTVIFFAGGGTNSAPINFSAYTLSKIALIKAVELLDAEHQGLCFTIIGPGWVKTKIHSETLRAGKASGQAHKETSRRLELGEFTPMSQVIDCCDWLLNSSKDVIGGRNFSVVHDPWGNDYLNKTLRDNPDMYKLRRHGNDLLK
jgi:NAD(P)-dependent dehydrogenase (short-subunit alcohol dehydrogenase family)